MENKNEIISDCFLANGGNYKHFVIWESLSKLGLESFDSELMKYQPLANWYDENTDVKIAESQSSQNKFSILDELVAFRNDVAHGVSDEILSENEFIYHLNYIEKYAESLNLYLNDDLLNRKWNLVSGDGIKVEKIYSPKKSSFRNE